MTLEQLQSDMIQAMKIKNKSKKDTLSSVISAIKKNAIDSGQKDNITEELVNNTLLKEQKIIKEMIDTCPKDRIELKNEYVNRLYIINQYCPQLIDDPIEIERIVIELCGKTGYALSLANRGNIMRSIVPQLKGKVDMKIANQVISKLLN